MPQHIRVKCFRPKHITSLDFLLYHRLLPNMVNENFVKINSDGVLVELQVVDAFQCPSISCLTFFCYSSWSEYKHATTSHLSLTQLGVCSSFRAAGINGVAGYCSRHQTKHAMRPAQVISMLSLYEVTVDTLELGVGLCVRRMGGR